MNCLVRYAFTNLCFFLFCPLVLSWQAAANVDLKEHLFKVLVVGDIGTGKTSIIKVCPPPSNPPRPPGQAANQEFVYCDQTNSAERLTDARTFGWMGGRAVHAAVLPPQITRVRGSCGGLCVWGLALPYTCGCVPSCVSDAPRPRRPVQPVALATKLTHAKRDRDLPCYNCSDMCTASSQTTTRQRSGSISR